MKVSINAGKIGQVVNAETAQVTNQQGPPGPSGAAEGDEVLRAGPAGEAGGQTPWDELAARLPDFAADLAALGQLVRIDHGSALNKMRTITERVLHSLCQRGGVGWGQGEPTLERMIGPLLSAGVVPRSVGIHVRTVQTNASPGSHYQESALTGSHVEIARAALAEVLAWFAASATGGGTPAP